MGAQCSVMTVVPVAKEAKAGGSFEPRSWKAWQHSKTLPLYILRGQQGLTPVI
jgi:hypothetical protein